MPQEGHPPTTSHAALSVRPRVAKHPNADVIRPSYSAFVNQQYLCLERKAGKDSVTIADPNEGLTIHLPHPFTAYRPPLGRSLVGEIEEAFGSFPRETGSCTLAVSARGTISSWITRVAEKPSAANTELVGSTAWASSFAPVAVSYEAFQRCLRLGLHQWGRGGERPTCSVCGCDAHRYRSTEFDDAVRGVLDADPWRWVERQSVGRDREPMLVVVSRSDLMPPDVDALRFILESDIDVVGVGDACDELDIDRVELEESAEDFVTVGAPPWLRGRLVADVSSVTRERDRVGQELADASFVARSLGYGVVATSSLVASLRKRSSTLTPVMTFKTAARLLALAHRRYNTLRLRPFRVASRDFASVRAFARTPALGSLIVSLLESRGDERADAIRRLAWSTHHRLTNLYRVEDEIAFARLFPPDGSERGDVGMHVEHLLLLAQACTEGVRKMLGRWVEKPNLSWTGITEYASGSDAGLSRVLDDRSRALGQIVSRLRGPIAHEDIWMGRMNSGGLRGYYSVQLDAVQSRALAEGVMILGERADRWGIGTPGSNETVSIELWLSPYEFSVQLNAHLAWNIDRVLRALSSHAAWEHSLEDLTNPPMHPELLPEVDALSWPALEA